MHDGSTIKKKQISIWYAVCIHRFAENKFMQQTNDFFSDLAKYFGYARVIGD